jgi:hypothetical protein
MAGNEPFNKKWTRFCETILREGGFAKPRLMFLKFGGIGFGFPPRRRVREECGVGILDFLMITD